MKPYVPYSEHWFWGRLHRLLFGARPVRHSRQIYKFWDGSRYRMIDPVEAWGAMEKEAGDEWVELLRTMSSDPPPGTVGTALKLWHEGQADAASKVASAVCAAFGVEPLKEADDAGTTGLTRAERIALAADFVSYMGDLAHAATVPTTSLSPTAASPVA